MFIDLTAEEIQPQVLDAKFIPEIIVSEEIRSKLETVLNEEEVYAKVSARTSVVQTDKNCVTFSNQWLIFAVACRKYAEALLPYGVFLEKNIKGNTELIALLRKKTFDDPNWCALFEDPADKEMMEKYLFDDSFRPGKKAIDTNGVRQAKELLGSSVLKKIPVPDNSSGYLGNLIYYLAKRPELYGEVEEEISSQMSNIPNARKLSGTVKECAKEIIDLIYDIDGFKRIENLFKANDKSIKIDVIKTEGLLSTNSLRYMFEKPNSPRYSDVDNRNAVRSYADREYEIVCDGEKILCHLSDQWKGNELTESDQGNNINALILVTNKFYADVIKIEEMLGERFVVFMKQKFTIDDLPEEFKTDFSKRYITSLLAKPFVILTGNSGTGKTRISKQFAEYLEWKSDEGKKNWLMVPVGADWTDNSKILGFYNPIASEGKGKYEKTEIVELIEEANKHTNIPYFLILDEMNLSHVERYFSDFLSHMETPDTTFSLDGYDGELTYPDNLFVVGTVNIDETTYMFSPKVLDRANVIEFKPEKESVLKLFSEPSVTKRINAVNDGSAEVFLKVARDVRNGKLAFEGYKKDEVDYDLKYVERIFGEVYEIIQENGFEFAYRTVKEIRQYISAAYEIASNNTIDLIEIVDQQILQKVLPKIHGNKKEIGQLLDRLEAFCAEEKLSESEKKITQMKGKLSKIQYASFI